MKSIIKRMSRGLSDLILGPSEERMRDEISQDEWDKVVRRIDKSSTDEFNWIMGEDGAYKPAPYADRIWLPEKVILALWRKASINGKCDIFQKFLNGWVILYESDEFISGCDPDDYADSYDLELFVKDWRLLSRTSQDELVRNINGSPLFLLNYVRVSKGLSEAAYRKVLKDIIDDDSFIGPTDFCFLWTKISDKPFVSKNFFTRLIDADPYGVGEDVFNKVLMSIDTSSYEREIFLEAIASNNAKVYKRMVMLKKMNPLEETSYGYDAIMMAAKLGDIELFEWILTFPGAEMLLGHKTHNGATYIDFAKKAKQGAFLNYVRDREVIAKKKKEEKRQKSFKSKNLLLRTHPLQQIITINTQPLQPNVQKDLQADLYDSKTLLNKALRQMGYFDNPKRNLQADLKNPTSPIYALIHKLGYKV